MIFSDAHSVDFHETTNMFGVNLLRVTVCYNEMEFFSSGFVCVKHKIRIFAKSEGTPWVESNRGGKYTRVGGGAALELSEYCSHYGHIVPKE